MAQTAKRATIAVYDGQVVISDIVKRKTTVPIFSSNEAYSATLVTSWYDGSPMDDTKADGSVYFKLKALPQGADPDIYGQYVGSYFRVNLPKFGETFLEKDTMQSMRDLSPVEVLLLEMGYYKGVKLNGYYVKEDAPSIIYSLSTTPYPDNEGNIIVVGDIKLEHKFIGDINVRNFGVKGDASQDVHDLLDAINEVAVREGLNIYAPSGTYNSFNRNMPYRNSLVDAGLRDFNNITLYGDGNQTIFKSDSVTGADVFQLNAVKNLTIMDLAVTATQSSFTHSGSNGFSVTNGFDNVNLINVHCFDLPSVPYSDPLLNYLDGGKAFTIQSSRGNSNPHGRITIKGTSENVGYGFGHDAFVEDIYTKNIVANIDISVKRCFKGVAIAFGAPLASFSANDKSLNYNLKAKIEDSQWDITMNRVFGGNFDYTVLSTLDNDELKKNPLTGTAWLSSRPNSILFNLAPVKNCNITINGYKKICDQKGAIGSVGSISEPLYDGGTRMSNIEINVGGVFTQEMTINTNAESKNVENCNINLNNFSSIPSQLFSVSNAPKSNSIRWNGIAYNPKTIGKSIFFKQSPSDADTQQLMLDSNGYLTAIGQRIGSSDTIPLLQFFGYKGGVDVKKFSILNNGGFQMVNNDGAIVNVFSGNISPEGGYAGGIGDLYIQTNSSNVNIYIKTTTTGSTGWKPLQYKQATAQANISQADLVAISTADATDLPTALTLLNELKAKYNLDVALTNALKASQNTELTNQRTAGQQAP